MELFLSNTQNRYHTLLVLFLSFDHLVGRNCIKPSDLDSFRCILNSTCKGGSVYSSMRSIADCNARVLQFKFLRS